MIFSSVRFMSDAAIPAAILLLGAFLTGFFAAVVSGAPFIRLLTGSGIVERTEKTPIEDKAVRAEVEAKRNIPTMGGLIIGTAVLAGVLLWGDWKSVELWLCMGCFLSMGLLGALDDYLKIKGTGRRDRGLKVRHKLLVQGIVGMLLGLIYFAVLNYRGFPPADARPLPGREFLLGFPALLLVVCVLAVAVLSNAVNVADGMDGLAGGLSVAALLPLAVLAAYSSPGGAAAGGVAVFCAVLGGAILGFLWYNVYPARVFMGDTGALAIGGALGPAALLSGWELLLPILAFVFFIEFASSVIQVLVFKATGRRIFSIAPLHHVFQRKKWPEMHTVARFWIAGLICSLTTLAAAAIFSDI